MDIRWLTFVRQKLSDRTLLGSFIWEQSSKKLMYKRNKITLGNSFSHAETPRIIWVGKANCFNHSKQCKCVWEIRANKKNVIRHLSGLVNALFYARQTKKTALAISLRDLTFLLKWFCWSCASCFILGRGRISLCTWHFPRQLWGFLFMFLFDFFFSALFFFIDNHPFLCV